MAYKSMVTRDEWKNLMKKLSAGTIDLSQVSRKEFMEEVAGGLHPNWEYTAKISELARGFLVQYKKKTQLRDWAGIILASDLDVESTDNDNNPDWDVLGNALWDASFGNLINQETIDKIDQLAKTE